MAKTETRVYALVVVAAVAYTWWSRESAGRAALGWDAFYQALAADNPRPDDFEDIAKANLEFDFSQAGIGPGSTAGAGKQR